MSRIPHPFRVLVVLMAVSIVAGAVVNADVIYVDDDAPNDPGPGDPGVSDPGENGTSGRPFDAIQEGIDAATDGDEVIVLPGTYAGDGNRDIDFAGKAIHLRSVAGADETVVDCQGMTRGFSFYSGEDSTSIVEGFTVTNGFAYLGGGICCWGSSPTIMDCVISGNSTVALMAGGGGGGIYCEWGAPTIVGCLISSNSAQYGYGGGGIYAKEGGGPTIRDCVIENNWAGMGGGILCVDNRTVVANCTIRGNSAGQGGGIACQYYDPIIESCVIVGNSGSDMGGGILAYWSYPTVSNCTFSGNTATGKGGAIACWYSSRARLINCVLWNDSATHGEEVYVGYVSVPSMLTIRHSDVEGGQAGAYVESGCVLDWDGSNIVGYPGFGSPGDFHLPADSPCVDAGDNRAVSRGATDLDGQDRIVNCAVDMGAYEFDTGETLALCGVLCRKLHGGAGELDVVLPPAGGFECRNGGLPKVVLPFNRHVQASDGVPDETEVSLSVGTLDAVAVKNHEITITMTGVPDASCQTITLTGLADSAGTPLNGGSPVEVHIAVLAGNINNDFKTDLTDMALAKYVNGWPLEGENIRFDVNLDGKIDLTDMALVKSLNGHSATCLVAPPPMVLIPAGEFQMGDTFSEGGTDELPVHAVYVDAFYMDRYEVTNQAYADALNWAKTQGNLIAVISNVVYKYNTGTSYPYCDTTTSSSYSRITWNGSTFGVVSGKENHPMVQVSWYGSVAYANWRSAMQGKPLGYDLSTWECNWGSGYRLPTEAEWEKAARGDVPGHRFPWSDSNYIQHARANYYSSSDYSYDTSPTRSYHPDFDNPPTPYTSPVGYFAPNGYGLYDMAGNVWEWCNDWYSSTYYGSSPPYNNPHGPISGAFRVLRGGCWGSNARYCRVAYRDYYYPYPGYRDYHVDFRLALGSE